MEFGRKIAEGTAGRGAERPARHRGLPGTDDVSTLLRRRVDCRAGYGPVRGAARDRPRRAARRGVGDPRCQRRRQDHHDAGGLGHDPAQGCGRVRRSQHRQELARRDRPPWHRPGAAGPWHVHRAHRRGQPARRRVRAPRRRRRRTTSTGGTRPFPRLARPPRRRRRARCRAASSRCWPSHGR